ncbi:hypothetical protein FisN_4Lh476 [Fistulifera solaris]|uniref:Protein kinase domain-containing protein n=1 Tax=Fistulifera solaris TaxID=1519565 RepID=A0A1Z5KDM0_FISSO|nr:hypothetical protein FisN_4Lh476 [Fistulifera solaris]|eukprot:GAX24353.1 hypothetical protein FisN_4Lh476 [Fistulifera solaris]
MAELFEPQPKEWPEEVEDKYQRFEVLGKGSFGMVWMSRRTKIPEDENDDEFVAIKEIKIKDEKSEVYAEREISILSEIKHPNIIRMIRAYPVHKCSRVVVMQLARGPNLHQLVVKRGALGLPLARLVSRELISAVSYLHGRAVIHRDIKPSNCILACNALKPTENYDWTRDNAIWTSNEDAERAVREKRWKLYLVDFGFARALEKEEIDTQTRHLRNSILFENATPTEKPQPLQSAEIPTTFRNIRDKVIAEDDSEASDDEALAQMVENAASKMRNTSFTPTNNIEDEIMGTGGRRQRLSGISMQIPEITPKNNKRVSHARQNIRSMSALGTKAYAAPEIRKKLRHKTEEDLGKENAALTECVADYGMIVDAYSVGWTLRVAITGVPPNFTLSEYMKERESVVLDSQEEEELVSLGCCCFFSGAAQPLVKVRDPSQIPREAMLLITSMTEKKPEDRMTVREAQLHPYIAGGTGEESYSPPQGDIPSNHGDPVVPLLCASALSKLTIKYHMT